MASNDDDAGVPAAPQISPTDRDLAIRTMIGEAGGEGLDGQAGVGAVMLNRLAAGTYGKSLSDVALAKGQFEPWSTRQDQLMAIDPNSPQYQQAAHVFDGLASGAIPDITMGATHFYAPGLQASMGRNKPSWAQGEGVQIGHHTFFAPNGPVQPQAASAAPQGGQDGQSAPAPANAAASAPSQPASPAMASASQQSRPLSDDDIDAMFVGPKGKAPVGQPQAAGQPASSPSMATTGASANDAPPLTIRPAPRAAWEQAPPTSPGQTATPPLSDDDIAGMYTGPKSGPGSRPAVPPVASNGGVRDPSTGELVVGGKGFTPDDDNWSGVRNFANGALLGAGVPLEAGVAALKAKLWDGSGLPLNQLYQQAHDSYAGARTDYQAQHPIAAPLTEAAGNMLTAVPATMAGGALLGSAGNMLLNGMESVPTFARAVPAAESLGNFLTGNASGGLLKTIGSRAVAGAGQGAAVGAMSAGLGNQSVGDAALNGAEFGATIGGGLPAMAGAYRYGRNALTALAEPFTQEGVERLAQRPLQNAVGNRLTGDASEIIPGSKPTFAEAYPDANAATIQRTTRDLNPQPYVAREAANAAARNAHFENLAGTPEDVEAASAALDANAHDAIGSLFRPGQIANAQPVVDTIDGILNGPGGKRDAVRSVMNNIRAKLVNSDGTLESDPQTLYDSVRKQIGDLLDKRATASDPAGQQASRELLQVRAALDQSITNAVPGFDQYLSDYSASKRPIEAMKYLQGLNLTDVQGNITLAKVDSAMKNIGRLRMADGPNPAKSLTDEQLQGLAALHDDLLRASNTGLGRSAGSATAQNLATQGMLSAALPGRAGTFVGKLARPEVIGASLGTFLGDKIGGGIGAAAGGTLGAGVGRMATNALEARNAAVRDQLDNLLLNPQLYSPAPVRVGGQNLPIYRPPSGLIPGAAATRNKQLDPPDDR